MQGFGIRIRVFFLTDGDNSVCFFSVVLEEGGENAVFLPPLNGPMADEET